MSLDVNRIRADRKRKLDEIAKLQEEVAEIDLALRVYDRYAEKQPPEQEDAESPGLAPRPPGTPTTFQMVNMILAGAEKDGREGLTSRELLDEIAKKYWPGVHRSQILPSIFGFGKVGRIRRIDDKWYRAAPQDGDLLEK